MNTANRPGASGSRRTGPPFPIHRLVRGVAACALLAMAGFAGPAAASVLYRCTGAAGEVAYVSSRAGYRHCVEIGSWPATRHHAEGQRLAEAREPPRAVTIAGKPPTPVKANPAVIKVIPLGTEAAPDVRALTPSGPWQPLPLAVLDALGREVLPRLLRRLPPRPPAPSASPRRRIRRWPRHGPRRTSRSRPGTARCTGSCTRTAPSNTPTSPRARPAPTRSCCSPT